MLKLNCNSNTGNNNTYDTILCRITLPPLQAVSPSSQTWHCSTPPLLPSHFPIPAATIHVPHITQSAPEVRHYQHQPSRIHARRPLQEPSDLPVGFKTFPPPSSSLPIMSPFLSPWYGRIHTVRGRISNTATLSPGSEGDPLTKATEANRTRPATVGEF